MNEFSSEDFTHHNNFITLSQNSMKNKYKCIKDSINDYIFIINQLLSSENHSKNDVLDILNKILRYTKAYEIGVTTTMLDYDFIPNLIYLYCCDDKEISYQTALILQSISSKNSHSDIIECMLSKYNFIDPLFSRFPLNQKHLEATLECIHNIIIDFDNVSFFISQNENIIKGFFELLSSNQISSGNQERIIIIFSNIVEAEFKFKEKISILDFSIKYLQNDLLYDLWPALMKIPTSMIINQESSNYIFQQTKVLQICQTFIRSENDKLIQSAVECVGKHFLYNNTGICIDYRKILKCSLSTNYDLSYSCLWLLSNALASGSDMIYNIEVNGNIYEILSLIIDGNYNYTCKTEAINCMISIITQEKSQYIFKAVEYKFLEYILLFLENDNDESVIRRGITAIVKLLRSPDPTIRQKVWDQYDNILGDEVIDELIQHSNTKISDTASSFKRLIISNRNR